MTPDNRSQLAALPVPRTGAPSRMSRVIAVLAMLTVLQAHGTSAFHDVDAYVGSLSLPSPRQQSVRAAGSPQRIFGVAYGAKYEDRKAVVFVLARKADGSLEEVGRSPAFDFQDPSERTDVEIIQAQSNRRFSIQVNSRSMCGVYVTVFRFAETPAGWVLSGKDASEPACGANGEVLVQASTSTNFLTGDRVAKTYDEGKLVKRRGVKLAPRSIPLSAYQMWSDDGEPDK